MVEISLTKSWKIVKNISKLAIILDSINGTTRMENHIADYQYQYFDPKDRKGYIRDGHFDSVESLCNEINEEIDAISHNDLKIRPKLYYDYVSKYVYIHNQEHHRNHRGILEAILVPDFSKEIADILGYDSLSHSESNKNYKSKADRPADINAGHTSFYVLMDLLEPQYVGDTRAKLLRAVGIPTNVKFGEQILINYDNPHYIPILTNEFENIEIDIKDDTNERVSFMFGRTRVKLHFRKVND